MCELVVAGGVVVVGLAGRGRFRFATSVGIWSTEIRSQSFNVPDKRANQPASRQVVHAVVGEQCAVAEEAEQQSGGAGRSTGPFPADLTQGPLQRKLGAGAVGPRARGGVDISLRNAGRAERACRLS